MSHCLKRLWVAPLIAAAITVVTAGTAVALVITGTGGHDRITGSRAADTIDAKGGPDAVFALAGNDVSVFGFMPRWPLRAPPDEVHAGARHSPR